MHTGSAIQIQIKVSVAPTLSVVGLEWAKTPYTGTAYVHKQHKQHKQQHACTGRDHLAEQGGWKSGEEELAELHRIQILLSPD